MSLCCYASNFHNHQYFTLYTELKEQNMDIELLTCKDDGNCIHATSLIKEYVVGEICDIYQKNITYNYQDIPWHIIKLKTEKYERESLFDLPELARRLIYYEIWMDSMIHKS